MRNSVFLDELSDPAVAGYLKGFPAMVLVPTGATEQHGPHGPLGTDVMVAREVCRRVGEAKSALVAPSIPYGLSAASKGFKGVASLKTDTFTKLITDVTTSLADGGFRRIVFVNGHATNYAAINLALLEVSAQLPERTRAFALTYWETLPRHERDEFLGLKTGLHANVGETSATLAIRPDAVEMEEAVAGWPSFPQLKGPAMPTINAYFEAQEGSRYKAQPGGVWGDPTGASRELGTKFLDQITQGICNVIDDTEKTFAHLNTTQSY